MSSVFLSTQEKIVVPKLKLHTSANKLNEFVKETHRKLHEKETIIKNEEKDKKMTAKKNAETFKKEFNELKKKTSYIPISEKETKEDCTLRELSRIFLFFKENKYKEWYTLGDMQDFTGLGNGVINDAVKFLVREGIMVEKNEKSRYFYKLGVTLGGQQ